MADTTQLTQLLKQYLTEYETIQRCAARLGLMRAQLAHVRQRLMAEMQTHNKLHITYHALTPDDVLRMGSAGYLRLRKKTRGVHRSNDVVRELAQAYMRDQYGHLNEEEQLDWAEGFVEYLQTHCPTKTTVELERRYVTGGVKRKRLAEHEVAREQVESRNAKGTNEGPVPANKRPAKRHHGEKAANSKAAVGVPGTPAAPTPPAHRIGMGPP